MDGAEIRILKQVHQERLRRLLQRLDRLRLPPDLMPSFLGEELERDFAH